MSKNAALEKLINELEALPAIIDDSLLEKDKSILLTRLIRGVSSEKWQQASHANSLDNWHAIPAKSDNEEWQESLKLDEKHSIPVTPFREMSGVITRGMFIKVLERELARLVRNGGNFSLLSSGIVNSAKIISVYGKDTLSRLQALLASIIMANLESCDSIGILRKGQFLCSLPGLGQLAARNIAEKTRKSFLDEASTILSVKSVDKDKGADCAIGIVNLLQGDNCVVNTLIKRSSAALEMALSKPENHIYQETSIAPLENTTLVQSSEKRFLFFGE